MTDKRNGMAENLVDAVTKEATGQVAKGIVNTVKVVVVAAAVAIIVLANSLWSVNPLATVALLLLSFLLGIAIGIAFGWKRACKMKDTELAARDARIDELEKRPTKEQLDRSVDDALDAMKAEIASRDAEIAELESKLRHPVPVSMDALFAQPWQVRRAVLDAADKGWTDLPLEKAPSTVLSSMLSVEGIFRRRATLFSGMKSERETYYVTPEWKLLLMEDGNVEKLRVMVNG